MGEKLAGSVQYIHDQVHVGDAIAVYMLNFAR